MARLLPTFPRVCRSLLFASLLVFTPAVPAVAQAPALRPVRLLVDDFEPRPYQGDAVYYFNRMGGDRGVLNNSVLQLQNGVARIEIASGLDWGGLWTSLSHSIREHDNIYFSAVLPRQIDGRYQTRVTGLSLDIVEASPGRRLKVELRNGGIIVWSQAWTLTGAAQTLTATLPPLGSVSELAIVLDQAAGGDFVTTTSIALSAETSTQSTAEDAFVWTFGMLLANWNRATGLVRDKSGEASGEFDALQATGVLAATTALADQLGVISRTDAVDIVTQIERGLQSIPRYHGLWPHWVRRSASGEWELPPGGEYSSVDTSILLLSLAAAERALDLDTSVALQALIAIDWAPLRRTGGLSHGYDATGAVISHVWDTFGSESLLVGLAYAASTGQLPPLAFPTAPTANGSGYIDALLEMLLPPPGRDAWGNDWLAYRETAVATQRAYFATHYPQSCMASLNLFGLSAAEVPWPSDVAKASIYQPFGVGGRFSPANDGLAVGGRLVVTPHYSAMVSPIRGTDALAAWQWLIDGGFLSPLNHVESFSFEPGGCTPEHVVWNELKGSWNLGLEALGWGQYLLASGGQTPDLWRLADVSPIASAYDLLFARPVSRPIGIGRSDYDGDGRTDIGVWRQANGWWYVVNSSTQTYTAVAWGVAEQPYRDVPVSGDYDGDGKTDIAVWRQANGWWYVINSSTGAATAVQWGDANAPYFDVPVPGDYDGDGKTDIAVWRQANGWWYVLNSSTQRYTAVQWGVVDPPYRDVPVPGDYDGDGKTDIAVWRQANGWWYVINSSTGAATAVQWGDANAPYSDVPVPGDYDGDGKTDMAVWRQANGWWYVLNSSTQTTAVQWGVADPPYRDVPVPGDYDGDGKTDIAVWRRENGWWYVINSATGAATAVPWGVANSPYRDMPAMSRPGR